MKKLNKRKIKQKAKRIAADILEGAALTAFMVGILTGAVAINAAGKQKTLQNAAVKEQETGERERTFTGEDESPYSSGLI